MLDLEKMTIEKRNELLRKFMAKLVWVDQFHDHGHWALKHEPEEVQEIVDMLDEDYVFPAAQKNEFIKAHPELPNPSNAAEFIDDNGRRFAWSESNVRYEEVEKDDECFTLLRRRLERKEEEAEQLKDGYRILRSLATGGDAKLFNSAPDEAKKTAEAIEALCENNSTLESQLHYWLKIFKPVDTGDCSTCENILDSGGCRFGNDTKRASCCYHSDACKNDAFRNMIREVSNLHRQKAELISKHENESDVRDKQLQRKENKIALLEKALEESCDNCEPAMLVKRQEAQIMEAISIIETGTDYEKKHLVSILSDGLICTCDEPGDSPCRIHKRENELQDRVIELEKLAYIGEHHFPDAAYKQRLDEAEKDVAALAQVVKEQNDELERLQRVLAQVATASPIHEMDAVGRITIKDGYFICDKCGASKKSEFGICPSCGRFPDLTDEQREDKEG